MPVRFREEKRKKHKKKGAPQPDGAPAPVGPVMTPTMAFPPDSEPPIDEAASDTLTSHVMLTAEKQLASLMKETEELRREASKKAPIGAQIARTLESGEGGAWAGPRSREGGDLDAEFGGSSDGNVGTLRGVEESVGRRRLIMGPDGKWTTVAVSSRGDADLPRYGDDDDDDDAHKPKEKGLVAVSKGTVGPGASRLGRAVAFGGSAFDSSYTRSEDADDHEGRFKPPVPPAVVDTHANPTTLKYLHGLVMGAGSNLFIKQKAGKETGGSRTVWN